MKNDLSYLAAAVVTAACDLLTDPKPDTLHAYRATLDPIVAMLPMLNAADITKISTAAILTLSHTKHRDPHVIGSLMAGRLVSLNFARTTRKVPR